VGGPDAGETGDEGGNEQRGEEQSGGEAKKSRQTLGADSGT
jgi:hypothetical protein